MKKKIVELICTGFYSGKSPIMPGTCGSILAIPFAYVLGQQYWLVSVLSIWGLTALGILLCDLYEKYFNKHDAKEVVFDEVVGYLIAMFHLPVSWQYLLAAFVLFRIFDIWKPFPISVADKKWKGGFGVMMDDVMAGLITNIILQICFSSNIL